MCIKIRKTVVIYHEAGMIFLCVCFVEALSLNLNFRIGRLPYSVCLQLLTWYLVALPGNCFLLKISSILKKKPLWNSITEVSRFLKSICIILENIEFQVIHVLNWPPITKYQGNWHQRNVAIILSFIKKGC